MSGTEPDRAFGYGLVNASGAVESIGTVSDCQVINTPGEYVLDQDISTPLAGGVCVYVSASDVTIDGQGHTINGVDGSGTAVYVQGPSAATPVQNVTVTNLTVESAQFGVGYENVTASSIEGVTARNHSTIGIAASGTSDITVRNVTAVKNPNFGLLIQQTTGITVTESNVSANADIGINLDGVTNATIADNEISDNDNTALWAASPTNLTVERNTLIGNDPLAIGLDTATDATVRNNTVTSTNGSGIYVTNSPQAVVSNNDVDANAGWGVQVELSGQVSVTGNQLDGNVGGVKLLESDDGTLSDNVINGSNAAPGVSIESSSGTLTVNNTVTHTGPSAIQLGGTTSNATVTGNNVSANGDVGINVLGGDRIVVTDNVVTGNDNVGIHAGGPTNVTIERNTIETNTLGGISSTHGQTLTVRNNTITGNAQVGIYIENISDATVTENEVTGTTSGGIGVSVTLSPQVLVSNNVVESSASWGIMVTRSDQNQVSGNDLEANGGGIRLFDATDSTVTNNIANDTALGIYVENATGTDVTDNIVTNNQFDGVHIVNGSNTLVQNLTANGNAVGLALTTTDTVTAENNNLSTNDDGAFLDGATAVTFADTQVTGNTNAALYAVNDSTVTSASNFTLSGGASVNFSAHDAAFAIDDAPPAIPSGTDQTGPFLEAVNTSNDGWIEFTLGYNESDLSSTVEESTLRLWRFDNPSWSKDIGGINTVDTANDTVTANVTTFSTFTLLAEEVPEANVTPSTLDFGDVNTADTPPTLDVTIANDGVAPLNVTDVSVLNDTDGEFTVVSGGGSQVVDSGNSTTVTVEFAPGDTGPASATLSISHNDTDASPSNVSLSGTGVAPNATVSPTAIAYGNVSLGASETADVTVTNDGSAPLDVTGATIANDTAGDFTVTAGASQVVQPGETANVTVEFAPGATGPTSATLVIDHNDTDATPSNVSLSGTGVAPNISVAPSSHSYGNVHVDATATREVNVTNTGTAPLNVSDAIVIDSSEFDVNASFPFVLAPGGSKNVTVDFAPTTLGSETGDLSIASNATNETGDPIGAVTVSLDGTGVGPNATVSPGSIGYGNVSVGGSGTINVTIGNDGSTPLNVTGLSFSGADASAFNVTAGGAPTEVAVGDTHNVTVAFEPSSAGAQSATLEVAHNASGSPTNVSLAGTGVAPSTNVTPASIDYGDVNVGTSATETVTLENNGTAPLEISGVGVAGPDQGQFDVALLLSNITVQPGDNVTFDPKFSPSVTGTKNAKLVIAHNASGSYSNVSLTGTGVAPGVNVTTADPLEYGETNVAEDENRTRQVVVENNGSAPLDLTGWSIDGGGSSHFSIGDTPTVPVQPDATATFDVHFQPTSVGAKTAYLNVSHNVSDRPAINVTLTGTGVAPNVSVVPSSHTYGDVHVNTTATRDVNVTNTGTAPLNVSSVSLSGSAEFALNGSSSQFVLGPDESRNVTVDFAPMTTGEETATLSIANNATNATGSPVGPVQIDLNGTGVGPNASISPGSLDLGNVSVGGAATADVTIENDGNATLEVTDVSIGGADDTEFTVTAGGGATTIAPGDTHNVTVEFAPGSPGAKSALLNISHNASAEPSSVSLAGTGIAPSAAVTPSTVDYGDVHTNTTANATVTVENDGTAPLDVTSIAVQGDGAFTVVTGGPTVLQPGDTATVTVEFAPDTTGAKAATLVVEHNASGSPSNVSLAGTGVAPDVSATPADVLEFGAVNVSDSANESVVIENNGSAPLDLSGAAITGPNASRFTLPTDPTPVVLAPGEAQTVTVQFSPDSLGEETAYLNVTHNASRPAVNVTLNGTGHDAQPPTFSAAAAANATDGSTLFGREDTVTVNATVQDNLDASVSVTVDASVLGNGTVALTDGNADDTYDRAIAIDAENATDGTHELAITANDSSGNVNVTTTNEITVDTTNATLSVTAPANGSVTNRTWVRVNATADDATSGVDRVQVNDSGWTDATVADGTWTHNFTGLGDGVHTFEVRAIDNASNVGTVGTVTVTVDTTSPVIQSATLNRTAGIPPEGSLGVAVEATDATAGVQSAAAGGTSLTQSASWWNGTVEAHPAIGNRTLSVTVVDAAGNANTTVLEYRVGIESPLAEDNRTLSASPADDTIRNVTINVNASATIGNETVVVGTSRTNPTPSGHPDDVALYFPQVNVSVANADIENATLTVRVAKSRVDETNADLDTIAFWVFENGTWKSTTGTLVEEDSTHLTYDIEAPHFSTYAITADTETVSGGGGVGGSTGGTGATGTGSSTSVAILDDGTARLAVDNPATGETATLTIAGGLSAGSATFDSVDLTFAQDRSRIEVDLRPHDSRPDDIPALEGAVTMGYVAADTGVPDRAFETVVFHFSVNESALPEGADLDDVALYRYDGSQWTELETTRAGTLYSATSPGFSVFAVGATTSDISVTAADLVDADLVVGETAEVSVTLENDGTAQGSYTVEVLANDVTVATTEATVPAGGTETVTLSWTPDSAGEYEVVVDEEPAGTLVVEEDTGAESPTTSDGGEEAPGTSEPPTETVGVDEEGPATSAPPAETPGDDLPAELPGIALVALLAVLALVGIYVYRQRSR